MRELRLKIGKMSCVNCANAIERAVKKLEDVEEVSISYTNSSGVFLLQNESVKEAIKNKITQLGFEILQDEVKMEEVKQKK
ncbi:cation transporter, partial [Campylobacter jejuni]